MNAKSHPFILRAVYILASLIMLIPALWAGPLPVAWAANTGWRSPTANAADFGGDGDGFERNPTNAYGDGGGNAESRNNGVFAGDKTERHRYYNYGLNVPTGATIYGIEVRLDWWLDSTGDTNTMGVELSWDGGSNWTSAKTDSQETTSQHTVILGSTTDTWGRTWSPSDFSDANFRVRILNYSSNAFGSRDFYLDWAAVRVTYNRTPSAPTLVSPANGAYVNDNTPTLSWNASTDPDGDTLNYAVSIDDGVYTDVGTATSYTTGVLAERQYTWQVRAYDGWTNGYSYSDVWYFTVDTDIPATPDYLYEGDPDQDYYPLLSYTPNLPISWGSVADTGSGITYQVQRRVNFGGWTDRYTGPNVSFDDTGTFVDNDFVEYQVRARNGAGNTSGWRQSDGIRIDSTDPATVAGVGEGVSVGADDDWSRDNVYLVYWGTVADTGSGIAYEVQRCVNGGLVGTCTSGWDTFAPSGLDCTTVPGYCFGDDSVGHSDGDIVRYQVRAVNGAGRTSPAWSTSSDGLTLDLQPPDSNVTTGGVYNPVSWPDQIAGTASDGGSGVTRVDIIIIDSDAALWWDGDSWETGTPLGVQAGGTTAWTYAFPESRLIDGHTYSLLSCATDVAGNVETDCGTNQFTYAAAAPEAPAPWSTTHVDPNTWYNNNQPSFEWNEPASPIGIAGYSIQLDQYPGTVPDKIQDTTQRTYDAATTPDGVWYFHVRAVDVTGQWGPAGHVRVNIDTTAPQTPGSVTEENPDVNWDDDGGVTVYWSAVPNTGSGIAYALERCVNGGLSGACTTSWDPVASGIADTYYAHNPGGYSDGNTVRYRVRAANGVGLPGGWRESDGLTIDSSPVAAPAWVYEDAAAEPDRDYHNSAAGAVTVRWAGVTDTGSGIAYRLDKCVSISGACTNPTDWTLVAQGLSATSYADSGSYSDMQRIRYRVTAVNGVGAAGAAAASDGMLIDLDIPALPGWVYEGSQTVDWDYHYDGSFTVYWAAVANTGSGITYRLEKSVNDGAWELVAEGLTGLSRADTNNATQAPDGTVIKYRVTPVNGAGTAGPYKLSDGITLDRETPAAPGWIYEENSDVDFHVNGDVTVYWAAAANTGSGITYDLQWQIAGGGWLDLASDLTTTSFRASQTFGDETFIEYRVLARNGNRPVGQPSGWTVSDGVLVDRDTPAQVTGVGEGLVVGADLDYVNANSFIVYWTGVSATATGDQIYYTVERNVNGGGWSVAAANVTATSWDDPQAYSNGDQVLYQVTAINGAGTSGSVSTASDGVTVDTGQPNSTVATTGYYNATSWPGRINGASTDDYAGVRHVQVTIYDTDAGLYWDGAAWAGALTWLTATDTTNWYYLLDRSNLLSGHTYSLQSRATDEAGNVEASFGINSFTYASQGPQAPVVASTTHPDQDTWYNHNDPILSWTTVSSVTVAGYAYVLDQNPGTMPLAIENLWTDSISLPDVGDGAWYFHVRARDSANNWGPAGHYALHIDTTTPGAPTGVTEESPDVDWDYDGSVTVYWTVVSNTGSGIVYIVEREVSTSPGTWVVLSNTVPSTQYLDPATGYADGAFIRYRVSARNGVNLTGSTTQSDGVTVDNDAPLTPAWVTENAADPNDQDYDSDGSVRVYWAASNNTGSGLTYRLERQVTSLGAPGPWTLVAEGLTSNSYLDPLTHQDGEFVQYHVTAINGVGSFNAPASSDGIRIDVDTPAAPAEVTENSPDMDWSYNGSVTVFWGSVTDTGSGITFRLEKQVNSGVWTLVPGAGALPGGTTSFPDSGAYNDGDVIRYRVRAINGAGLVGAWRESDGMTIDSNTVAAPGWVREENPDVDYDADGALTVYWAAVSDTGSGITYRLEKQLGAGSWNVVAQGLAGTSYYDGQTQPDGTEIHYRVAAVNGVNTAGSATASDGITVDIQTPAAPANLGEGDAVGTDDEFDQDNTFYVYWTAPADTGSGLVYDIQKRLNGGTWVAATSGVEGASWEDPVSYSNGDLVQYRVRAVNGAGLEGAWSEASSGITLDFALPDSAVTTHGYYNAYNWPGFVFGAASDTGSDVGYVDITIRRSSDNQYWSGAAWVAGETWLRATDTYNWQYAFALANLTDGVTYTVRSRATDNADNVETTIGQNTFTYSGSGPAAPAISSSTHPVQTNWYDNNDPAFSWTVPSSAVPVVGYSFVLDQLSTTTPDAVADTAGTTASFVDQADGAWWFHVRAGDSAGNWGAAAHFRVNIDTTAPPAPATVTEESPDVAWDSDGTVAVYWGAVPDLSGVTYRLERNVNGMGWVLVPNADALTVTSREVGAFDNGDTVLFRVRATNGAGLSSAWTESNGVSFDTTTPAAPANVGEGDVAPTDDDWDQDNAFLVFWTAVPGTPSGITYSVERNRNNNGVWELMVSGLTATQWEDSTSYSSGESVAYRVTAHTGAGLSGAPSASSDGLALDFSRPDSAVNTSGFYNTFTWPGSIQGTASDSPSDVAFVDITIRRQSDSLYWAGSAWVATETWLRAAGAANWSYTFAPGDGQTYNLQSRATDHAGNVETTLGTSTFNYSSSGPDAPTISSPTHPNPAVWYNNNDPTLNWTTPSSGSGIKGYSYVLDHTPDTEPDLAADTTGNTRSYTNITDGLWYFHVRAVDNADNWGPAAHLAVRVDTTAPAAPAAVTEESPDVNLDADGNITVYWSGVTDTSDVTYSLERSTNGGASWASVSTGITTTSYLDPVTHPDATQLIYRVRAVDSVGLTSAWRQSNGVTIDSQTPARPTGVGEGDIVGADNVWDQDNTFYVFWNAVPDTGSTIFYTIERSINGGVWQTVQASYAQTFWDDPQVFTDTSTIRYRITAVNGVGTVGPVSADSSGITMDLALPDSAVTTSGSYGPASWTGSIQGTASDATSGVSAVQITLQRASNGQYWNGTTWGAAPTWLLTTGAASWSYAFVPTSGESYNVQSRAVDAADNWEVSYGVGSFSYTTDEPDSSIATNGLYVGAAWPGQIGGAALAPMAAVSFVDLTIQRGDGLYFDGTSWGAAATWLRAAGTNSWSYGFAPADGETYTVRSRATDAVGNVESVYGSGTFSYDAAAPAVDTVNVTSDSLYFYNPGLTADGGTVYLNTRAGEGAGQTLTVAVTMVEPHPAGLMGGTAFGDMPPADTAAPWTAGYSVEANAGTQSNVLFTVADTLGLTDTAAINFVQDNLPPNSKANIANEATNSAPITVDWEASDSGSGVREVHLWVKYQPIGAWTDTGLAMVGMSGSFVYTPTSGSGTYYFATVAIDQVRNVESAPAGFGDDQIDFDDTPPDSTMTAPMYAGAPSIVITWTASFDAKYTYLYYRYGETGDWHDVAFSIAKSGIFDFTPTDGDGHYYFATVAMDEAGNPEVIAQDGKGMTIYDTVPPVSAATSPAAAGQAGFTVEWTGDDTIIGAGITFFDVQVKVGDGVWTDWLTHTTETEAMYVPVYVDQDPETFYFRSRATDNAGHVEEWPIEPNGDTTTMVSFGNFVGRYRIFLPLVASNFSGLALPDLIVEEVQVVPAEPAAGEAWDIRVTVRNIGNVALSDGVWVDLYVDPLPQRLPIKPNTPFFDVGTYGGVWWVSSLAAGESIVLTKADIPPDWLPYFPDPWQTPGDHTLYVQVDSVDERTATPPPWARVYEANENNNVYGPLTVHVGGVGGANVQVQELPPVLPERRSPH
ncbi:MAG: Ig-like domain repeat protein [Anaerolineae bacterium]|nr:Ig-like domain repeat protein [Anaerolineae bacterium]